MYVTTNLVWFYVLQIQWLNNSKTFIFLDKVMKNRKSYNKKRRKQFFNRIFLRQSAAHIKKEKNSLQECLSSTYTVIVIKKEGFIAQPYFFFDATEAIYMKKKPPAAFTRKKKFKMVVNQLHSPPPSMKVFYNPKEGRKI